MVITNKKFDYKQNNRRLYLLWMFLSTVVFILEYLTICDNCQLTKIYEFQLLMVYGIAQYGSIKKFGMFNIFSLILVGFFIFAIGGILHFFISNDNILEFLDHGFGDFYFTNMIMQESLLIYSLFIALSYLTYSMIHKGKGSFIGLEDKNSHDDMYFKIGKFLMWAFLAVEIYKGYLYFSSFSISRVLIYLYGNMENPVPTWVRFFATFFEIGYAFILCSKPEKSVFKKYSALFFVVIIPEILLGNRAMFGAFMLYYFWYYARFYNPQPIRKKYVLLGGVLILLIFQIMQFMRDGGDFDMASLSLTSFLKGQATSFYILPIYIQNASSIQYYLYPFILYPIIGVFSGYTGQSIEALQHKCGVGHQLIYTVSPDYYLNGGSFGSSNIVELYDLGVYGVIIGAVFFSCMLYYFEKKVGVNRIALFMSYHILSLFIMSSRGSFFPSLYDVFKLFVFYSFITFCYKLLYKKKNIQFL